MASDFVDIWYGQAEGEEKNYPYFWPLLDDDEKARAGKMKNALLRFRYVEVHGRLRQLLAKLLDQAPDRLIIKKNAYGKPYLPDFPELVFNLTHSGGAFLIAAGYRCRLGVDLERCIRRADFSALVNKCFAEEERNYWNRLPEAIKPAEFYRFWTRKEAFVKAAGRGLALGLRKCVVNPQNPAEFLRIPAEYGLAATWRILDIDLGHDVCAALAVDKTIFGIRFAELE